MGTLRVDNGHTTGGVPFVLGFGHQEARKFRASHETISSVTANQGLAVAFAENSRAELRLENGDGQICCALKSGGGKAGQSYPAIAFSSKDHGGDAGDIAPTMRAMAHSGSHANAGGQIAIASALRVRRLMPVECERLQGFPDSWTLVPYRGKDAKDGPRYKALGNSMAVNCMRWIGRRIRMVECIMAEHAA